MQITDVIAQQREFFLSGKTNQLDFRIASLKRLYRCIQSHEQDIHSALKSDLGKSDFESYMCETGLALSEISYMISHTKSFAQKKRVRTPPSQFSAHSYTKPSPYGNTLIMSPWNYPFLLCMEPLANAIAAGNTVIVKPSAYASHTSAIVKTIIEESFDSRHVACITGGRIENTELLNQKFDLIFFTGSTAVGKEVLRHAAEHVTPTVLELGGKSPCIVDKSADIELAAKRIVFGKYLNCGQTCVAPDYILCHESVHERFIKAVINEIDKQYPHCLSGNSDYGHIINDKHFSRITRLIDTTKIVYGGNSDKQLLVIEPCVMSGVSWDDPVMQEEIFGPIMPILSFTSFDEIYLKLAALPKPLALYLFANDKHLVNDVMNHISFGGGCVNDTIIHLATTQMGFGGVGESGMGSYHGKAGFDIFSHSKSIVDKHTWIDLPIRYCPHTHPFYKKLVRLFLH